MAASKLSLYQGALRELGERKLSALTDNVESRRVLDTAYDGDFVDFILSRGQWNFATRSALVDIDASVTPPFGFTNAFTKPSDWIRTTGLSEDEYFTHPLRDYSDEAGVWYAESDALYVKWVSNAADYGADFSKWPANFTLYVQTELASRVCTRITQNESKTEQLVKLADKRLRIAQSTDAMNDAPPRTPVGSWVRARYSRSKNQRRAD